MTLKIALDWTPNTNHTGLFVAQDMGYYAEQGLDVILLSPEDDHYATTPAKKLELGLVDFAIAPFESVISLRTKARPVAAVAVAALLQRDISSIAVLATSAIMRPRDLDGRTYASYQARYEDAIVRQLIVNDGGRGDLTITYPEKLGIWQTLLTGTADATWIFDNWEGVEADTRGLKLTKFALADYGIPYGYSPVVLSTQAKIDQHAAPYRALLAATRRGYEFAVAHPQQAADILAKYLPARETQVINILKSQEFVNPSYGVGASWGMMDAGRVASFLHWLINHQLEDAALLHHDLYTNDLLR